MSNTNIDPQAQFLEDDSAKALSASLAESISADIVRRGGDRPSRVVVLAFAFDDDNQNANAAIISTVHPPVQPGEKSAARNVMSAFGAFVAGLISGGGGPEGPPESKLVH